MKAAVVGIAPIVDPVASRAPIDPATIVVFALAFLIVLILAVRKPPLGLAALVAFVPYDLSRDVGPTTVTLAKVSLLGLAIALAIRRPPLAVFASREARLIGGGAVAIFLATALSIHAADFHGPAIRESLKALQYLGLFAVAMLAMQGESESVALRRSIVFTTAGVTLVALAQIFTGAPSGVWFSGHAIPRIAGPLEGPNQLSGFLGLALPCVFAFALGPMTNRRDRIVEIATLGIGGATLLLTLSRAGVLSCIAALALTLWLASRSGFEIRRGPVIAIGAGLAGGVAILGATVFLLTHSVSIVHAVIGHFGTAAEVEHAGGVGNRSILWHAALALWRAHPIFGVGAGNFELEISRVGPPGIRTHANSLYLQTLVEGGLPLFLATVGSVATTLFALFGSVRRGVRDPLVLGVACGLAGLAVHQIFDLLVFYPKIGDLVWTLAGATAARIVSTRDELARDVRTPVTLPDTNHPSASAESSRTR